MNLVLLAVGGTGGHIYPAVALAQRLRRDVPSAAVCIAGKLQGQERRIAERYGIDFQPVRVVRAPERKLPHTVLIFGGELMASVAGGLSVVNKLRPAAVVGFGGYVSFPTVAAAAMLRRPVYLHEQNAEPGKANLALARIASGVFISYESTSGRFGNKAVFTGNPSRYEGEPAMPKEEARVKLGLDPKRKTIFVFGGSQGAKKINEAVYSYAAMNRNRADMQILHVTGPANYEEATARYSKITGPDAPLKVDVRDYLNEMILAYRAADITVSRAGATTISELTSLGAPALLVPYPFAAEDHQRLNALELVNSGAAKMIEDKSLNGDSLAAALDPALNDESELAMMGAAAARMYRTGAAKLMSETLMKHFK